MDFFKIKGGTPIDGDVVISGAKNAALPILIASILSEKPLTLHNVPRLTDIETTIQLLSQLGVEVKWVGNNSLSIDATSVTSYNAPYGLVKTMRASILVLGPLLARFNKANLSLPGGCAIGARPVDIHLKGLEQLGADVQFVNGDIESFSNGRLVGANIHMPIVSVGATENVMSAAVLADGVTTITNAACEPEVVDLANFLISMGADIRGAGTNIITIVGVQKLQGTEYSVMPDRIETGTYLVAAAATQGRVKCLNSDPHSMSVVLDKLIEAGATINIGDDWIELTMHQQAKSVDVTTAPHPAFPTDMQAQFVALNAVAQGGSSITETVFENRFMHVPELVRMGADLKIDGRTVYAAGGSKLQGAKVMATDLRASASLVIAALTTETETEISRVYHIDRGYDSIDDKLRQLGVCIERCSDASVAA